MCSFKCCELIVNTVGQERSSSTGALEKRAGTKECDQPSHVAEQRPYKFNNKTNTRECDQNTPIPCIILTQLKFMYMPLYTIFIVLL